MSTTETPLANRANESEKIMDWKMHELLRAGFDCDSAEDIAMIEEADWRLAVRLKDQGVAHNLIMRIVT